MLAGWPYFGFWSTSKTKSHARYICLSHNERRRWGQTNLWVEVWRLILALQSLFIATSAANGGGTKRKFGIPTGRVVHKGLRCPGSSLRCRVLSLTILPDPKWRPLHLPDPKSRRFRNFCFYCSIPFTGLVRVVRLLHSTRHSIDKIALRLIWFVETAVQWTFFYLDDEFY